MATTLATGVTFTAGTELHANGAPFGVTLTVVRTDPQSYGQPRYITRDEHGRHYYAYANRAY
jgi:hypothetical protein